MEIFVTHNMEVAHRLFLQPGKCQQIHGHSMEVTLNLRGDVNKDGIFEGLDFGYIKKHFRAYLDHMYDHHLLLNKDDPWATRLWHRPSRDDSPPSPEAAWLAEPSHLPGLVPCDGDPTTENLAKWICSWAYDMFRLECSVTIQETMTNGASFSSNDLPPLNDGNDYDV
jgi:6-pyruvoyl-tetrahydropterin synthase